MGTGARRSIRSLMGTSSAAEPLSPKETLGETAILGSALGLPQHPDQHRSERPVLLAVDQELGEGPASLGPPVRADRIGSLEV